MFIQLPSAFDALLDPAQPEKRVEPDGDGVLTIAPAARHCRWAVGSATVLGAARCAGTGWLLQVNPESQTLTWTAPAHK